MAYKETSAVRSGPEEPKRILRMSTDRSLSCRVPRRRSIPSRLESYARPHTGTATVPGKALQSVGLRPLTHLASPEQDTLSTLHDASLDQIVAYVRAPESADAQLYATLSGRALLRTGLIVGEPLTSRPDWNNDADPSLDEQAPARDLRLCCTHPSCANYRRSIPTQQRSLRPLSRLVPAASRASPAATAPTSRTPSAA